MKLIHYNGKFSRVENYPTMSDFGCEPCCGRCDATDECDNRPGRKEYGQAIVTALSSRVEFVEEDQKRIAHLVTGYKFDEDSGYWFNADHTDMQQFPPIRDSVPYDLPIDDLVEEVEQYRSHDSMIWKSLPNIASWQPKREEFNDYRKALRFKQTT